MATTRMFLTENLSHADRGFMEEQLVRLLELERKLEKGVPRLQGETDFLSAYRGLRAH